VSIALTYIDVAARSVGIPEDFSFYLVSLCNAGMFMGRLMTGFGTDAFGTCFIA
jgi:MFS transporter, MCT family, solute carrier family 16 (monocarboxylic acid transporters), member 10